MLYSIQKSGVWPDSLCSAFKRSLVICLPRHKDYKDYNCFELCEFFCRTLPTPYCLTTCPGELKKPNVEQLDTGP